MLKGLFEIFGCLLVSGFRVSGPVLDFEQDRQGPNKGNEFFGVLLRAANMAHICENRGGNKESGNVTWSETTKTEKSGATNSLHDTLEGLEIHQMWVPTPERPTLLHVGGNTTQTEKSKRLLRMEDSWLS